MGWKSLKALILSAPLCGANNEVAPKGNRMRKKGGSQGKQNRAEREQEARHEVKEWKCQTKRQLGHKWLERQGKRDLNGPRSLIN